MAENNEALILSPSKLVELDNEYKQLSKKAHFDSNWETDYQAAYRAPAAFLMDDKATNFETTFDRILFHLDEAFKKADDIEIRRAISRTADDQFSQIVFILQLWIAKIKKENEKGFIEKLSTNVKGIIKKASDFSTYLKVPGNPALSAALSITPDVANLLVDYLNFLNTKWGIKKDETEFYNQVSSVYQKILDSQCFNKEFGLLRNTFIKNKEDILTHVVYKKNLTAGKNLTKYDINDSEKQDSARIILNALASMQEWELAMDYLKELEDAKYANYKDLKKGLINWYESIEEEKIKGVIKSLIKGKKATADNPIPKT